MEKLCTEGAPALTRLKKRGFQGKVTETAPYQEFIHCIIHRQDIVAKMKPGAHQMLQNVINMLNFIKTRPLNSWIFTTLCYEIKNHHENLLYHTEVCCFLVVNRLKVVKYELRIFLSQKDECSKFAENLHDNKRPSAVRCLVGIFKNPHTQSVPSR